MQEPAITDPTSSSLISVEVVTKNGDHYCFPAMDSEAVKGILPRSKHEEPSVSQPTLSLVNASYSVLSIPFRIIKTIMVDGNVWWECSRV
jgi:hypothetical protein